MNETTREREGLTVLLARRAAQTRTQLLAADVRLLVRQSLLDYLGVSIAGAREKQARMVADEMIAQSGRADAGMLGRGVRLPAMAASLANGTAAHALDFDDVNMAIPGHPAAVIFPAALAVAEELDAGGAALAEAYVAGYDTMCSLGLAMGVEHYDAGFHATATLGCIGAAAACGRLYALPPDVMAHALGLAAAQAAGLKSMFGTMTKPLNAGRAAATGVLAAKLARRGFESRVDAVESEQGMAALMAARIRPEQATAREPGDFLRQNLFKRHVACYLTHAAIESARELRERHGLALPRIAAVIVRADRSLDGVCNIADPRDSMSAKFSLKAATALALLGRDTGAPAAFEAFATDDETTALAKRVTVSLQAGWPKNICEVELRMTNGATDVARWDSAVADSDLERQGTVLRRKFDGLTVPLLGRRNADRLAGLVDDLERLDGIAAMSAIACGINEVEHERAQD
ncbi:MAG TPA: MmgE/PrpD family protein [Rhizomicrobium sp.]